MKRSIDTTKTIRRSSTHILRAAIAALGLIVLALCIFVVPSISQEAARAFPDVAGWQYPVLAAVYLTAAVFYVAAYHTVRLLAYIDTDTAFSQGSATALQRIKYCAIAITLLYAACMPYVYLIADRDDAPGLILIGTAWTLAPVVVAVFAAVLQRLVQAAIDIKSENDLTV